MKIIYNRFIPFKGFTAMAVFGRIYARKEFNPLSERTVRHEKIHAAQAKDMGGWIWFYIAYFLYWIEYGYRNSPFEKEAYGNDFKSDYLMKREKFAWKKY